MTLKTSDHAAMMAEAERLLAQITPGEWRVSMTGYSVKSNDDDMPIVANNPWGVAMKERQVGPWLDNAEFIAAAPRLVRELRDALLAKVRKGEQEKQSAETYRQAAELNRQAWEAAEAESARLRILVQAAESDSEILDRVQDNGLTVREALHERERLVARVEELERALKDLLDEAVAEGHDDADDFGWQPAIRAAEAMLKASTPETKPTLSICPWCGERHLAGCTKPGYREYDGR